MTPGHPGVRVRNVRGKSGPKNVDLYVVSSLILDFNLDLNATNLELTIICHLNTNQLLRITSNRVTVPKDNLTRAWGPRRVVIRTSHKYNRYQINVQDYLKYLRSGNANQTIIQKHLGRHFSDW